MKKKNFIAMEFQWTDLLVPKHSRKKIQNNKGKDPVVIERSNLVNICKLIVKELIEQSLKRGRVLDSDHVPLQHFFILIEHALQHRLKPRKNLLGPEVDLWDVLQIVEKSSPEARDVTMSVRDLPTVKTSIGRSRAWLRIALMQKKLADYLKVLVDNREILMNYYEPNALMLSDEIIVIIGLLVGLNVIDCNLMVKGEDLDDFQGVIDFSLYLKSPAQLCSELDNDEHGDNLTKMLDQKNYIEEINIHLKATVTNLESKVESLTVSNAQLKEDLAIAKNDLVALSDENRQLREELTKDKNSDNLSTNDFQVITSSDIETNSKASEKEVDELKQKLEGEKKSRQETVKELEAYMCIRRENEVAMKLLEKDIHEKQDTIVSLRRQLDDIKQINIDMYKKLQDYEASLKHKTELIAKLEAKTQVMNNAMESLENKYKECENSRALIEQQKKELNLQAAQHEEQANTVESDLKTEREWRQSLQESMQEDREKMTKLQTELSHLKIVAQKYATLQEDYYNLKERCTEQEQTLEELGTQLSTSKLEISDLKEEVNKNKVEGTWVNDKSATHCKMCKKEFSIARRKHHCRNCGEIFCNACSDNTVPLPSSAKPVRVCDDCLVIVVDRYSVM